MRRKFRDRLIVFLLAQIRISKVSDSRNRKARLFEIVLTHPHVIRDKRAIPVLADASKDGGLE